MRSRLSSSIVDEDDEDEDYSASIDALLRRKDSKRRGSTRRGSRSPRRASSPFTTESDRSRRRSSTMTSTSGETQISMEDEIPEEEIFENIRMHKEVIASVRLQAWRTRKKLKVIRQAKGYVKKHEHLLEQRLAQSKSTKDIMARYKLILGKYTSWLKRELVNLAASMVPWEQRIKRIESQFGSVVASYFTFLRWMFWINIIMSILIGCFIIIPEVLAADRKGAGDRKELLPTEEKTAFNLQTLWDFEGILKYSPIFYGYYTNKDKTKEGYRLPFAYFMTSLGMYAYSFWAILKKMAENSRMSKLSEKDDECTFTWKLFTGWDYMIGNSETSQNKVASIVMGFKESILEERESKKDDRDWKLIALRVIANFIIILLLGSSAYAVVLVVERSQEPEAESSWWRQNEVTVVLNLISLLYPNLFEIVGIMEKYHPRNQLQWQLARIMMLNMLNLYTLNFALFDKVQKMSLTLDKLKPNTTTFAPPTTTTILPTTTFNWSDVTPWPTVVYRYVNTSAGIFNLTGMDPRCTVIPTECEVEVSSTPALPQFNWTTSFDNTTLWPNITDWLNWTLPDLNSTLTSLSDTNVSLTTLTSVFGNSTEFPDPMLVSNTTMLTLLLANTTLSAASPIVRMAATIHPSLKSLSLVFLPPELLAKMNNKTIATLSSMNVTDFNTTELISTFSSLFAEWFDNVTSSPLPFNWTEEWEESNATEAPQCFAIWCPEPTTMSVINLTDPWTTTPFTTTMEPTTTPGCLDGNCTERMTTEEIPTTTLLKIDGYEVNMETRILLRKLCWETMFGQELVKLTVMDLVMTVVMTLITDFIRAVIVRLFNNCCCWDLEKQFPGYGDFKIAENILHLVNNQGMIWMGAFFSPGLPGINLIKLVILMYIRSWAVLTCNIPHETVFRASRSNNFYYALLLTMLFVCTLPVAYAVVWLEPSWHCGPFSTYSRIYRILTQSVTSVMPDVVNNALDYFTSPSIVIPLLVLLTLIIYYLLSLTQSLRDSNKDLKLQLRRERTEERRKVFQMADGKGGSAQDARHETGSTDSKWPGVMRKILPVLPNKVKEGEDSEPDKPIEEQENKQNEGGEGDNDDKKDGRPSIVSDDDSIFVETDQETSSVVFVDEEEKKSKSKKGRTNSVDVPRIKISKVKDVEAEEEEKSKEKEDDKKDKDKKDKKEKDKKDKKEKEEKKDKDKDKKSKDKDKKDTDKEKDKKEKDKKEKEKDKKEKDKKGKDKKDKEKSKEKETEVDEKEKEKEKDKKEKKEKDKEKDKKKEKDKDKKDKEKDKDKKEKEKDKDKKEKEKDKDKKEKEKDKDKKEKEKDKKEKKDKDKDKTKEKEKEKEKEKDKKKDKEDKKKEKEKKGKDKDKKEKDNKTEEEDKKSKKKKEESKKSDKKAKHSEDELLLSDQDEPKEKKKDDGKKGKKSKKKEEIELNSIKDKKQDDSDSEDEERKEEEQVMKEAHLKGDGMFEDDTVPLVDDLGTPSSMGSGHVNSLLPEEETPLGKRGSEEECEVSEVTVLIQEKDTKDSENEDESDEDEDDSDED